MRYHIHKNGQTIGPYSAEEVRSRLQAGELESNDLACPEGASEWSPVNLLPDFRVTPPPPLPTSSPASGAFRPGPVIRDVVIIWVLTSIGGLIVGTASPGMDTSAAVIAVAISNLLLGTIGFLISGYLVGGQRWRHLLFVALGVWITSLVNIPWIGATFVQWLLGSIFIAFIMGVGGSLSYLFRR